LYSSSVDVREDYKQKLKVKEAENTELQRKVDELSRKEL
jgi:hypothetical protein